jgi:Arc/MetJ-type ribon-helix-helix transcriptional regulator
MTPRKDTHPKLLIRLTPEIVADLEYLVRSGPQLLSRAEVIRQLISAMAKSTREMEQAMEIVERSRKHREAAE